MIFYLKLKLLKHEKSIIIDCSRHFCDMQR
jgi:hypothetical protein